MPKIKTREIHRGNIKTFDRAQDLSARMRTVEPKTKSSRSSGNEQESASIATYGEKQTASMVRDTGGKTAETMSAASFRKSGSLCTVGGNLRRAQVFRQIRCQEARFLGPHRSRSPDSSGRRLLEMPLEKTGSGQRRQERRLLKPRFEKLRQNRVSAQHESLRNAGSENSRRKQRSFRLVSLSV